MLPARSRFQRPPWCALLPQKKRHWFFYVRPYNLKTMKTTFFLPVAIACAFVASSCNNQTSGTSQPIDSVNQKGHAPVDYQEGSTANPTDTTRNSRDQYSEDTLGTRAERTVPSGHGTNSSNTTDSRTTSGSANHGDADQDRKK